MTRQGWECPRCTRVYAPSMMECYSCNREVNEARQSSLNKDVLKSSEQRLVDEYKGWRHTGDGGTGLRSFLKSPACEDRDGVRQRPYANPAPGVDFPGDEPLIK